ncbi:hypothetical protein [Actinomadura sp. NTSP31]|uniref:hypothetical protein n=1 Tax=Actinomadura sp. NTSP31 TaxID=1735447 RepID=UPI0035C0CBE7
MTAKASGIRTADDDAPAVVEYDRTYVVVRTKGKRKAAEHQDPEAPSDEPTEEPEDAELEDAEANDAEQKDAEPEKRRARRSPPAAPAPAGRRIPKVAPEVWAASLASRTAVPASRRWSVAARILTIVPLVALVAVTVLLYTVWQGKDDLAKDAQQRHSLAGSAGKVASVFFNWDYQHMSQSFAAKYPLLTKAAADAIRPTAATLTSYFTTNKVSSKAAITGIYPGEVKNRAANVMVVINTRVTTAKTVQSNTGATVALSMKLVSGKWLAGNITLLSQGVESATDENGKPLSGGTGSGLPGALPSARPAQ